MLSHENILAGGKNVQISHELKSKDKALCVLPLYHINGLIVTVIGPLVSQSSLVICEKFSTTNFWKYISKFKCTWFSVVPTIISSLLNKYSYDEINSLDLSFVRFGRSASAALAPETHKNFEQKFKIKMIETMGLTETCAPILSNPLPPKKNKYGSPGISYGNEVIIVDSKFKEIYSNLNRWQKTLVARHEERPKAKFFIDNLFSNFISLSGDRQFAEDKSVITGFGVFEDQSVLVIGQEKGDDLDSRIERNFGMMRPEGYRKCIRLMQLADKFNIPIILFIDTPGAYPGVGAEERGQAEAIARSIECSMSLKVPNISIIIGEGGSGGAIALASSNKIIMFENAIYSVISPEGCASILWRDPKKSLEAADAMKLSAQDLLDLEIIDEIIKEPLGGAHRNKNALLDEIKKSIRKNLKELSELSREDILNHRKQKFLSIGRKKGLIKDIDNRDKMTMEENIFSNLKQKINKNRIVIPIAVALAALISLILLYL